MMRVYKSYYGVDPLGQGFFWPDSEQKRREYFSVKLGSPATAQSVYQCRPGAREGTIFLDSDFHWYTPPPSLDIGISAPPVREFLNNGEFILQSWDTAFEAKSTADYSVGITAALRPCQSYHCNEDVSIYGECDLHYDVYILDVYRERLEWADLTKAARAFYQKWQPSLVVVEKKSSGIPLISSMQQIGINIEGVDANISKRSRALEGVGAGSVQGWFRLHRVLFPVGASWVDPLTTELKDFTGDDSGTDDQVDAIVHLVTWAIRAGGSTVMLPSGSDTVPVSQESRNPVNPFQGVAELEAASVNPFLHTCSHCIQYKHSYCSFNKMRVLAFDSCENWTEDKSDSLFKVL